MGVRGMGEHAGRGSGVPGRMILWPLSRVTLNWAGNVLYKRPNFANGEFLRIGKGVNILLNFFALQGKSSKRFFLRFFVRN